MILVPIPKNISKTNGFLINKSIGIIENEFSSLLEKNLENIININRQSMTLLKISRSVIPINEEGYKLEIKPNEICIEASTEQGAFYGLMTLKQILKQEKVETLIINDEPDLKIRGVMVDISRSKVPKVSTLKQMIDLFASLKYNHIELYVEGFSFEYKNIKPALKDKNYLTLEQYLELEKYANEHYMDFVPNQNGFGHMQDWLQLDEYKHLAECPEGFEIWGCKRPPSTLDPTSNESIELVKKMYDEMLPYTKSKYFNMNFDEPYELGHGKSKEICSKTSIEDVYIDYFNVLSSHVRKYNKIPMIWGDVLIKHPDKVDKLPRDMIFIDWGYHKGYEFHTHAKMLQEQNISYLLAPGTSTWSTITSRHIDMKTTIENSASAAKQYNGLGILITDWGDMGHLQYLPVSLIGFIYGGLLAWSNGTFDDAVEYLEQYLNDPNLTKAIINLSKYHELEGEYRDYGSRLFSSIMWSIHAKRQVNQKDFFLSKMKYNLLENENIELIKELFKKEKNNIELAHDCLVQKEMKNSLFLLETLLEINESLKNYLNNYIVNFDKVINKLNHYLDVHKQLWLARNIEEGYAFSSIHIESLIDMLMQLNGKEKV